MQSAFYEALYVFTLPNVFYLKKETEHRQELAEKQVNSSKGMIPRGMELISQGAIVTKDVLERLEAMQNAMQKEEGSRHFTAVYGQIIFIAIIVVLFFLYFYFFHAQNFRNRKELWSITALAALQLGAFAAIHHFGAYIQANTPTLPKDIDLIWFFPGDCNRFAQPPNRNIIRRIFGVFPRHSFGLRSFDRDSFFWN